MKRGVTHLFSLLALAGLLCGCPSLRLAPTEAGVATDASGADAGADDAAAPVDTGFTIVHHEPDAGAFRALWVGGPEDVYVAGDDGTLLEKAGNDWQHLVLGPGVDVTGVWGSSPNEVLAVATLKNTNQGPIFRRSKGTWVQIGTAPHGLRAVWGIGNVRYASGNDGVIYSGPPSDPLGTGVQTAIPPQVQPTLFSPIAYSIGGNSERSVMVAADYDVTTLWDGTTWHSYADPIDRTRSFRAIWGPPGAQTDLYEGANYYGLWHFTGAANPVSQLNEEKDQPQNVNRWIWGIWGISADKVVAVGDAGRIMTYDRVTGAITIRPSPTGRNLYAIGGTSLDDIWIVGEEQLVLHGHLTF